jgi:hypothetical protein
MSFPEQKQNQMKEKTEKTYEFIRLATPSIHLIDGKPSSIQTPPDDLLRDGVVNLHGELRLSGNGPHADTGPDDLAHQESSICQDGVPGLGFRLETFVSRACPLSFVNY